MAAQEKFQPRVRASGKLRIRAQPAIELLLERRILCEHLTRDLIGNVGLEVLLFLEARIEEAPGRE